MNMKGYIQGQTIILLDRLPEMLKDGDEVDISIHQTSRQYQSPFPTFQLGVKEEYLKRDKIYEQD